MNFDWSSFWINLISDFVFFILTIPFVIMFLPDIAIKLLRKRNKRHLAVKFSSILLELCEFLTDSQYRDKELNKEYLAITTKKKDIKNFKHVALCSINVFNKTVYPRIQLVINDHHQKLSIDQSYKLMTDEYNRLKIFRTDIERILSAHSLFVDEETILKISNLCFDIRKIEMDFKFNFIQDALLENSNIKRPGFFGLSKLHTIYESVFHLIDDIVTMDYFEYEIQKADE